MYPYRNRLYKFLATAVVIILLLISIFFVLLTNTKIFKDFGYSTLKPGQEITVEVKPKVEQVDYDSVLRIVNQDGLKLKFSTGSDGELWHDLSTDTFYNTVTKRKIKNVVTDDDVVKKISEIGANDGVSFDNNDFIMEFKGEKTFDVTNNKNYSIRIKNVSEHSGKVSIFVENT